jgi:hypothetical protein
MKTLDRKSVVEIHDALSSKGLKTKNISGENYVKLLNLKIKLKNSLEPLIESEHELAVEIGLIPNGQMFMAPEGRNDLITEFQNKLRDIYKNFSVEVEHLNFIPENELKEYCKDQDTSVEAVLFEYLLEARK